MIYIQVHTIVLSTCRCLSVFCERFGNTASIFIGEIEHILTNVLTKWRYTADIGSRRICNSHFKLQMMRPFDHSLTVLSQFVLSSC